MHTYDESTDDLADEIVSYSLARIRMDPPPLDKPRTPDQLRKAIGPTVTPEGIGGHEAFRRFVEHIAPATISIDHPRYLSFVPGAPTEAAALFDLIVGASSMYGGSWMEASGAVHAENEALRWVSDLAGFPEGAGGAFVSGGTGGNLSALVTARHHAALGRERPTRWKLLASAGAHSSIDHVSRVMDFEIVRVPVDERGRLTGEHLAKVLDDHPDDGYFAVSATAGVTNLGIVDDLAGVAEVASAHGLWFHVDGAYGGAALGCAGLPAPLRGRRAGRLVHRRPPQVAVLHLRLLRARCTGTRSRLAGPTPNTPPTWTPSPIGTSGTRRTTPCT